MTKPRCVDHDGNTVVLPERPPLWHTRPCQRGWQPNDIRKFAQGAYNARSAKNMKITLAKMPWQKEKQIDR